MAILSLVRISLYYLLSVVNLLLVVRCIISWFPVGYNKIIEFLYNVTEPILSPIRKLLSRANYNMNVDFSPVVAYLIITLLQRLIL